MRGWMDKSGSTEMREEDPFREYRITAEDIPGPD